MRSLVFEGNTWYVYEQLREKDKKLHKALCKLLKEMLRSDPASGLGKPEPLKHSLSGLWSKRISEKDRLIYKFDDQSIYIFAIGGHYEQFRRLTAKVSGARPTFGKADPLAFASAVLKC